MTGGDEGEARGAEGGPGVKVGLVAVGVDDVCAGVAGELADAAGDGEIKLAVTGDEVGGDGALGGGGAEIEVGVGLVAEDADLASVALLGESGGEVEDDGFRAVEAAAADEVEDLHWARPAVSARSGSSRFTRDQRRR